MVRCKANRLQHDQKVTKKIPKQAQELEIPKTELAAQGVKAKPKILREEDV